MERHEGDQDHAFIEDYGSSTALTPEDVAEQEFNVGMRGYVREEVRDFLRSVAVELDERDARIAELERRPARPDREFLLSTLGQDIGRTLIDAEVAAAKMRASATDQGDEVIAAARQHSDKIRTEARQEADETLLLARREASELVARANAEVSGTRAKLEELRRNLDGAREALSELSDKVTTAAAEFDGQSRADVSLTPIESRPDS